MSTIFAFAVDTWRECRDAYELHLEVQHDAADRACRGVLVNKVGIARGITSGSLFLGPKTRAHKYASEELLEFWRTHPRVTFAQFERQWASHSLGGVA